MRRLTIVIVLLLASARVDAQSHPAARAAREWCSQNERVILDEFVQFLSLPNVTRNRAGIQRNAEFILGMMAKRGISARLVTQKGANPIVFGEINVPGATRTIAFYSHYDGQPVQEAQWTNPPFTPTLRSRAITEGGKVLPLTGTVSPVDPEARLYARSASDDKGPILAMMAAVDAIRAGGLPLQSNIKFVFDGEEEALSPNLESMLAANRDLFAAAVYLLIDGPLHQSRRPTIYFGARGVFWLDLTVYGARTELHAGHYGNWGPNAAMMLARLLASMRDDDGRVLIEGFYDDVEPLNETERRAVAEAPRIDQELMTNLWLQWTEGAGATLAELITRPALSVRGLESARTGAQARSIIPSTATASLHVATVKGMDVGRTRQRILEHIRKQGYFVVEEAPTHEVRRSHPRVAWVHTPPGGLEAARTPMDLPLAQEVVAVVEAVRGPAIKFPNSGGAIGLANIERPLGTRTLMVPIVNHDNSQHSVDENLRIQNLWDGIELLAALMSM